MIKRNSADSKIERFLDSSAYDLLMRAVFPIDVVRREIVSNQIRQTPQLASYIRLKTHRVIYRGKGYLMRYRTKR